MKISIHVDELKAALEKVVSVTKANTPLPILNNILISIQDEMHCFVEANNLDTLIRTEIKPILYDPGEITVPGVKMLDIIKSLDKGSIVMLESTPNRRISIECKESRFSISTMSAEDWPSRQLDGAEFKATDHNTLINALLKVVFASSSNDSRFNLDCCYLSPTEDQFMDIVATDGHRLAKQRIDNESIKTSAMVTKSGVRDILKTFKNATKLEVCVFEKRLCCRDDETTLTSRLIDGEYPNYQKVIPGSGGSTVRFSKNLLSTACKRVMPFTSDHNRGTTVSITKESIKLSVIRPDIEQAEDSIPCEHDGEPFKFIMNVSYLKEALDPLSGDDVSLTQKESGTPVVFKGDDPQYFNLVMPMRE